MSPTPSAAGRAEPAWLRILAAGAAVAGFLVLRRVLAPWGVAGTAVAEWVAMVGVPVALLAGWGVRPGVLLRVGPRPGGGPEAGPGATPARRWTAALLVGAAGIPVAWFVTWLQGDWLPPDPTVVDGLQRQLLATDGPGLLLLLAAAVLTPAICEELIFRGAFLGALLRRWPTRTAILLSGLAFGLLHWVPGGGFRVLPVGAVGALLAWLAWRTRSVLPAMAAHGIHNTVVLVSAAWAAGTGRDPVWGIRGTEALPPPLWLLLGGVAILWLARRLLTDRGGPTGPEEGTPHTPNHSPADP